MFTSIPSFWRHKLLFLQDHALPKRWRGLEEWFAQPLLPSFDRPADVGQSWVFLEAIQAPLAKTLLEVDGVREAGLKRCLSCSIFRSICFSTFGWQIFELFSYQLFIAAAAGGFERCSWQQSMWRWPKRPWQTGRNFRTGMGSRSIMGNWPLRIVVVGCFCLGLSLLWPADLHVQNCHVAKPRVLTEPFSHCKRTKCH